MIQKKEKKIALVHDWLHKFGGAERVLVTLSNIFPEAPIYTILKSEKIVKEYIPEKKIITSFIDRWPRFLKNKIRFLAPFFPVAAESFDLGGYDIVISDSNSYVHGIITKPETKHICYCHSPMRYVWDWKNEYQTENKIRGLKKIIVNIFFNWLRLWDFYSADRVDIWIANSKNTASTLKKYYGIDAEVIYPPIKIDDFKFRKTKENYFLIVSRLESYKAIELAIDAFNDLNLPLIIIGEGSQRKKLEKMSNSNIVFKGFLDDITTREYFAGARALIFPGEEDFGIVPIEAMASGTPVIAYAKGGSLETIQEGINGIFFHEQTTKNLKDSIDRFIESEKSFDSQSIKSSCSKFDIANFIDSINKLL